MNGLDRYITGNYGEDSVPPDFCQASDLLDIEAGRTILIDIAPQEADDQITVTVTDVDAFDKMVMVKTRELAYTLCIPMGERVWFASE